MQSGQSKRISGSFPYLAKSRWSALAAAVLAGMIPASAVQAASGFDRVPPSEQLEQSCDVEAMKRLNADKVIAYTFADPVYKPMHIDAPGAVFRKNEEWYRLEYHCSTEEDHRTVVSFDWKVGDKVPQSQWEKYYLYP